ncbi:regulatory YrvL family protein [Halobacillus halophilus]|uniref:regulatory YrvL family protein n=1 Tax=Halobacillus halophilus TaxID=1570 RepID=UPI001CD7047B|nr:regulatory YrvL family protein [Halobacillus halophilus]MCA1012737.1 regulatory YrvL family protein [Halobacillus halophilus]
MKKHRFRHSFRKDKSTVFISMGILLLLGITIIFGVFFFGMVGLFQLMGVSYESVSSLLLFGVLIFILGLLFEAAAKIVKMISSYTKPSPSVFTVWRIFVDLLFTWLTIYTVDELVSQVTMVLWSEWFFTCLLVIVDYVFDEKKHTKKLA